MLTDNDFNALCSAVRDGNYELLESSTGSPRSFFNKMDESFSTLLHIALSVPSPDTKIIKLLLENGADANTKNKDHNTPLHIALDAPNPDTEIIKLLLENGADANIKNKGHNTPLHIVLNAPNPDTEIIKLLLEKGDNLNIEDANNQTTFTLMVKNRELWNSERFQKVRGYIKQEYTKQKKVLDVGYRYRYNKKNTRTDATDVDGENYLHIAAKAKNKDAFLFILSLCGKQAVGRMLGQMSNYKNGNTPFHEAAASGILLDVVKSLVNLTDKEISDAQEKVKSSKEHINKLEHDVKSKKKFIKQMLKRVNNDGNSPVACLGNKRDQKELKDLVEIRDPWLPKVVHNKVLVALTAALAITAFCGALCILYTHAPQLVLSIIISQAGSCSTLMLYKIYDMHNQDITNHTSLETDVDVEPAYDDTISLVGM
jgi:ankyrin repeat protein